MGYCVDIRESTWNLPAANHDEAYTRLCALNDRSDLKRSGRLQADGTWSSFAWMDDNYPDKCPDVPAILEALGFSLDANDEGLSIIWYEGEKMGDESTFLTAISDLATGYIVWQGEDGSIWKETYGGPEALYEEAKITFG